MPNCTLSVSPWTIWTWSIEIPSRSATSCENAVSWPWPWLCEPVRTSMVPTGLTRTSADSHKPTPAPRLPTAFDGEKPLKAFMGWDGVILFDKYVDVPAMTAEYMKRVQTLYCCGRCTPGKKGTKVLMDLFQNVLKGTASEADLDTVGDLTELLKNCKCTLCQSATVPVFDAVQHYREAFVARLNGSCPAAEGTYIHKITAPCMDKCPAHIDIPKYVEEIKNYQYAEALATIRENMPMPAVCGRVCPHPCETACRRKNVDDAINIMVLKRTASDYEWMHNVQPPQGDQAEEGQDRGHRRGRPGRCRLRLLPGAGGVPVHHL